MNICLGVNCRLNPDFGNKIKFIKTRVENRDLIREICEKNTHISEKSCQNKHHVYQKELTIAGWTRIDW